MAAAVAAYKEHFPIGWSEEKYKWEAVKHFQDFWDINASDFVDMFVQATSKTYNLLASSYYFPLDTIKVFAEIYDAPNKWDTKNKTNRI